MVSAAGLTHCHVRCTAVHSTGEKNPRRATVSCKSDQSRGRKGTTVTILRIMINLLENGMFDLINRMPYLCFLIPVTLDTENE